MVISDPTLNDNDTNRFVDVYMQMKDDGHIKYYTRDEFENLAESIGLKLEYSFISKIRFPRKRSGDYYKTLNSVDANILNGYAIEIKGEEIFITQRVLNLYFRNS